MNDTTEGRRLIIAVFYEGPWERLMNWLWYLRPGQTYRDVKVGGLRDRLANWADRRHHRWVDRWVDDYEHIPKRWKRRLEPGVGL